MSVPGNLYTPTIRKTRGADYLIEQSLLFNDDDSAYLTRTPGSAGNRKTWTFSCWVKRGALSGNYEIFSAGTAASAITGLRITSAGDIEWTWFNGSTQFQKKTSALFLDPNAWYHIVVALDTTNGTAADRQKIWVNGTRITSFSSSTDPGLNVEADVNNTVLHRIGLDVYGSGYYFDGLMALPILVDGAALDPTSFGELDDDGYWNPIEFEGATTVDFIPGSEGTLIGNMTSGGGLAAAFDGTVNVASAEARVSGATGTVGKQWSSAKTITQYVVKSPSDDNFGGSSPITIKLQGSNDGSAWTDLHTDSGVANTGTAKVQVVTSGITTSTAYTYHRIEISGGGAGTTNCAEVEFYEDVANSFGQNGFLLEGGTNIAAGTDSSGNGNDFTPSGTITATNDSPTDDATNGYGDYATLDPNAPTTGITYSNGNLKATAASPRDHLKATIPMPTTGITRWEVTLDAARNAYVTLGIAKPDKLITSSPAYNRPYHVWGFTDQQGTVEDGTLTTSAFSAPSDETKWEFEYDADTGDLRYYSEGSLVHTLTGLTDGPYIPYFGIETPVVMDVVFDSADWAYSGTAGAKALATQNITPPSVNPSEQAEVLLYDGTGAAQTITGTDWGGDDQVVFGKHRDLASSWNVFDSVRGATKFLECDTTKAETTDTNTLTAFNDDGFDLGADTAQGINRSGYKTMVLRLRAGTSGTNTDGSITSTVSANTTSGFSIVRTSGTGANGTVGHGLGVPPSMIIGFNTDGGNNWAVYHASLGATKAMNLNLNGAAGTTSTYWNDTAPTSSVFSVGTSSDANGSGTDNMIYYCFADNVYSGLATSIFRIGSYTGNGSTDGPMITKDALPFFWVAKRTETAGFHWDTFDSVREPNNVINNRLFLNLSNAEDTTGSGRCDFLSNGIKSRVSEAGTNASGGTYIYLSIIDKYLAGGSDAWTQGRAR